VSLAKDLEAAPLQMMCHLATIEHSSQKFDKGDYIFSI
jgi:hypothetical protein